MNKKKFQFRVWDKKRKKMRYESRSGIDNQNLWLQLRGELTSVNYPNSEIGAGNFVLMQSTGLKDAVGKPIFEGDILEENLGHEDIRRYTVEWGDDGWFLIMIDPDWNLEKAQKLDAEEQPRMSYFYDAMVIVGNVFE